MPDPDRTWKLLTLVVPMTGTVLCAGLTAWANIRVAEVAALSNKAQATASSAANVAKAFVESQPAHIQAPAVQLRLKELERVESQPPAAFRNYVPR